MSSIDTTQQTSTTGSGSSTPPVNPSTQMDENSFLKLLVAQLQYQDPMSPTDNQQFVQEQAQFSMVEGVTNLETTMKQMQATEQMSQATGMIGTTVDYTAADGSTATGTVSSVSNSNGAITLQVGTANVDPASVLKVSYGSPDTSGTQGTGAGA